MALTAVSATTPDDLVISCEHDPTGNAKWCDMWDNRVLGWIIDPDGVAEPVPSIIGAIPPAVDSGNIVSPQWIAVAGTAAIIPDQWRGSLTKLWDYLASNNGANRQLRGNFIYTNTLNAWADWANDNPAKVWDGVP